MGQFISFGYLKKKIKSFKAFGCFIGATTLRIMTLGRMALSQMTIIRKSLKRKMLSGMTFNWKAFRRETLKIMTFRRITLGD
jgi:hypothetical protein